MLKIKIDRINPKSVSLTLSNHEGSRTFTVGLDDTINISTQEDLSDTAIKAKFEIERIKKGAFK